MAWLAVDKDGSELCFKEKPVRYERKGEWVLNEQDIKDAYELKRGTIRRFLGKEITWDDDPIEIH